MSKDYTLNELLVRAYNVSLRFGSKQILKKTSIDVHDIIRPDVKQGQVVGILGPSGVGKTQFSRILAGLQEPTSGNIFVFSTNEEGKEELVPVTPGIVGMVAQNYPLFRHRTVMGNLMVALEHSRLPKKDKRNKALKYLDDFQLSERADFYPSQLSGGQRQRVAIIRELLCSENYLVMDEPFTGLDPLMKDTVCELIHKVATMDERNTIFVVAHDIAALVQIADTLWLFGRDRDENNHPIPGATIKKTYNLIDLGLAWRPNVSATREFADFVTEVKEQFRVL